MVGGMKHRLADQSNAEAAAGFPDRLVDTATFVEFRVR
jgi:hypothetical protein